MYKNLKDLFRNKYANQDNNSLVNTDRVALNSTRQISRFINPSVNKETKDSRDDKKTSYQTYLDLKHRLYSNVKNQPTSRPTSISKTKICMEAMSPFVKNQNENYSSFLGSQIKDYNQSVAHFGGSSYVKSGTYQSVPQSRKPSSLFEAPNDTSYQQARFTRQVENEIVKFNNQLQVQNAFNRSREPTPKSTKFEYQERSRGYLKDFTNQQYSQNQQQSQNQQYSQVSQVQTPKTRTTSKETVMEPINNGPTVKFMEFQQQYTKLKNQLTKREQNNYESKREQINYEIPDSKIKQFLKNNGTQEKAYLLPKESVNNYSKQDYSKQEYSKQEYSQLEQSKLQMNEFPSRKFNQDSVVLDESFNQITNEPAMRQNYIFHYVVGKGGFGKVWKVEVKKERKFYAMKEMSKSKIITKRSVASVMNERNLLSHLKHGFIVNMTQAFQDRDNLYLIMDLMTGGDLRYHIGRQRRFKEHQTRFFIACILLALEYLHKKNIIHRDLKPENLVLDSKGYAYLTDLGIARALRPENNQDTSGTPGYMAPEVMCRQNHGIAVDYFALGIIVYEFMMGKRPYHGRSRNEIRDQILAKQAQVKRSELPEDYSWEAADFTNKLLSRKAVNRLGFNGPDEVKSHPWLRDFPWASLQKKEFTSPYIPINIDQNSDYRDQISLEELDSNQSLIKQNQLMLRRESVQNLFVGYDNNNKPQE